MGKTIEEIINSIVSRIINNEKEIDKLNKKLDAILKQLSNNK